MNWPPKRDLAFDCLYGGQFTLSTQLIKPNYLVILPLTQHHSFFRNLPPIFICTCRLRNISNTRDSVSSGYPNTEKRVKCEVFA